MKINLILSLALTVYSLKSCELCIKLSQYNFDYIPLLDQNYCQEDLNCQQTLREISYRYLSGISISNPCNRDQYHQDCSTFGLKICSQILESSCNPAPTPSFRGSVQQQQNVESSNISQIVSLKEQLSRLENEANEVDRQLQSEVSRQKQKYIHILERLNELQAGI